MGSSESPAWDSGSIDLDSQQQRADDCGGTLVGLQVQSPIMQMADGGSLAERLHIENRTLTNENLKLARQVKDCEDILESRAQRILDLEDTASTFEHML